MYPPLSYLTISLLDKGYIVYHNNCQTAYNSISSICRQPSKRNSSRHSGSEMGRPHRNQSDRKGRPYHTTVALAKRVYCRGHSRGRPGSCLLWPFRRVYNKPKTGFGWMKTMADFMNFPTPRERVLRYGNTSIGIIPDICLVSHFQVGTWRVLYRPDETGNVKRWGLPLMIPNFSRLKDGIFKEKGTTLPIHGFGRDLPWTVIEIGTTSPTGWAKPGRSPLPVGIRSSTVHLAMQLSSSDATRPDYPYEFTFTATITAGEGTLTYTLLMENHSSETMPIAPGFHPYFAVTQSEKAN